MLFFFFECQIKKLIIYCWFVVVGSRSRLPLVLRSYLTKRDTQSQAHGLVDFHGDLGFGLFDRSSGCGIVGRLCRFVLTGNGSRVQVVQFDRFGTDHVLRILKNQENSKPSEKMRRNPIGLYCIYSFVQHNFCAQRSIALDAQWFRWLRLSTGCKRTVVESGCVKA